MEGRDAVIVAHGSPSEPQSQERAMADLATRVSAFLPGWTIRGATLAMPGGLERAMDGLLRPYLYPFFMASGYFTGGVLPKRLAALDLAARRLPPFGADLALPGLIGEIALAGAAQAGLALCDATLLLAAHGSKVSPASREATLNLVRTLRPALPFRSIIAGFLEEPPDLADAARGRGPSICLPLFALKAGHAGIDVPERLSAAGFTGSLLEPIGAHPAIPQLIAGSLARQAVKAAA